MIALENVSKYYKHTRAVDDISFTVNEGETLVLLGTSGCGKTTTLRMVNRLVEPTQGKILINGNDMLLQQPEQLRRAMGYVLQHTGLFPHYTVAQNIAIVPKLLKWDEKKITERTQELLEKLQLHPAKYEHQYPHQLSGGQQQRVGLARALAANPPVLLMDEPFGALDPVTRAGIRKEFKHLDELKKKTILMVTHDVQEAFELGDVICLMDKGRIVQKGKPAELLFKPASDFVTAFFEEQRFLLELKALTLMDVWDELAEAVPGLYDQVLESDSNLFSVMETLSAGSLPANGQFISSYKNKTKAVSMQLVLTAFANYKKNQTHG